MSTERLSNLFQIISDYHQLELSYFLKEITEQKGITIPELLKKLHSKDYCLSLESLYRYFSSSYKSNRFPPLEFIIVFSDVLQLTDEQAQLLNQFWKHYKFLKRCRRDRIQ